MDARYELDISSSGYGEIHVKANVFHPKLTVLRLSKRRKIL